MKRRLLIIGMFLLLGAVVNVAVAWSLIASEVPLWRLDEQPMADDEANAMWQRYVGEVIPPDDTIHGTRWKQFGSVITQVYYDDSRWPHSMPATYWLLQAGWPMHCMEGSISEGTNMWYVRLAMVPVGVRWLPFALNTLLYSLVLWLLIPGPFVLRRFLRLRRGLCPKCAYPMGDSAVCTECGGELPKRASTT